MGGLLSQFVTSLHKLNRPREIEVLLSLFRGCDFEGLAPGSLVKKDDKEQNTKLVVGFVDTNWRNYPENV